MNDQPSELNDQGQPSSRLPPRSEIAGHYLADEGRLVNNLARQVALSESEKQRIDRLARQLVHAVRAGRRRSGGIDAFLSEYGLTTQEGIILMCLAESLLRIPDAETADRLIEDRITSGDWERHLSHSDSLFVNASTFGLMLTGRVIALKEARDGKPAGILKRLVSRSGEPIIREALRHAMRILGDQFVLGRTIEEALRRARSDEARGLRFSFDMLGEAARTGRDAERYHSRYMAAIAAVGKAAGPHEREDLETLMTRPGISVKLSALHPRFEPAKAARVRRELVPRLLELATAAREHGLSVTIDAEEADVLDLTLQVFADTLAAPALEGWDGLGLAVQAYGRRAFPVLKWLAKVAEATRKRIPVRLVKGAYWDTEIKRAQVAGLFDYPVFTRKVNTDVSYLACARYLLGAGRVFYPQFATHNAHTIAAIHVMGRGANFEYQRLHGMGEALYEDVIGEDGLGHALRIYAPVGGHEDLLAYLVRRLLENGANTSFVNRLHDDELPVGEITADPVARALANEPKSHPRIPKPADLFAPERKNSTGIAHWEVSYREPLMDEINATLALPIAAGPIVAGEARTGGEVHPVTSPHDLTVAVGSCRDANEEDIAEALAAAAEAQAAWDRMRGAARAEILERAADLYEHNRAPLMAVMIREAGKTIANAHDDVREAVDFLRYYASEARKTMSAPRALPGPTGERNEYALRGRGVFACISPWNFPLAIFTGQIAAALAAGNAVLAKPAEQTPLVAFLACRLLHEAGVPGEVLNLLPGEGGVVGARLVADQRVTGVAFTGSNETADLIRQRLAGRGGAIPRFVAETGGINAMIVDSSALPEQVVRDVITSAFDSAGQRCSALRVLFLQEDIAEPVLTMLLGAIEELTVGDPLDYATDVGPVIDEAAEGMLNAHKLAMRRAGRELIDLPLPEACRRGTFVAPAVYEIEAMSILEREVFGPILHVVRYRRADLDKVCRAINATGYGLTLGLHSRIAATADFIAERVRVGNFYVNRNQIGAVVGVQPFGGMGLSGTGPKAGGPHTLLAFADETVRTTDVTATGGNAELLSLASERARADTEPANEPPSARERED